MLEQNLDAVVNRALDNDTCMYDPNCMEANDGADHGCLFLPETACRCWNRFLSRWELDPLRGTARLLEPGVRRAVNAALRALHDALGKRPTPDG